MMSNDEYETLKRHFRETGDAGPVYETLADVVRRATRPGRLSPALSPTGAWDPDGRSEALHDWLDSRLLRRSDLHAAFDFASVPGVFYSSLERSFRHHLLNAAQSTELGNIVDRATALLREDERFGEWTRSGRPWWGLATWRQTNAEPDAWQGSDRELVSLAWATGDYQIVRYAPHVRRASPTLSTPDLTEFLERLLALAERLLDSGLIRVALRGRFDLTETGSRPLGEDEDIPSGESTTSALEEKDMRAIAALVLEELTAQRAEVLARRSAGATLEEIADALSISRGTADNELIRVGRIVNRLRGDYPAREILEIVVDRLSS